MTTNYVSLVRRCWDQSVAEVFAHFGYRGDQGEAGNPPNEKQSRMAKAEEWDFHLLFKSRQ